MKAIQKILGMLALGLSVGVAAQGCAATTGDEDVASQDAPGLEAESVNACPIGPPGKPVPISKEGAFASCVTTCMATPWPPYGPTQGQCDASCCVQITGCSECYLQ